MKPVLVWDCDEILLDFMNPFCEFLREEHELDYKRSDFHSYNLGTVINQSSSRVAYLLDEFYNTRQFEQLPAISFPSGDDTHKGLIKIDHFMSWIVEELADKFTPYVVTSRPSQTLSGQDIQSLTCKNLDSLYGGIFKDVIFTDSFKGHRIVPKHQICRKLNAVAIVEDCRGIAQSCEENGIPAYLLETPWSGNSSQNSGVTIFRDGADLQEKLLSRFS